MIEAVRIYARYDMPCELFALNDDGEHFTRREAQAQMGTEEQPPEMEMPDDGIYLWRLFTEIDGAVTRHRDGVITPIPPSEWAAWLTLTDRELLPDEWEILHAIDVIFCAELNQDYEAVRQRKAEQERTTRENAQQQRRR